MTVFKTFLKVLNKCKGTVILYTVMLVTFGALNMQTSDNSTNFVASKPDVLIINEDADHAVTKNFVQYMKKHANLMKIEDNQEAIDDALFYRDVNYIIYIPENFGEALVHGTIPEVSVQTTGDYQAYYAETLLERYMKTAASYGEMLQGDENHTEELIDYIDGTLKKETEVSVTSKLDTDKLSSATFYFNFMNYGLLAGAIFTICMILSAFREEKIRRRTMISSMSSGKHNAILLSGNIIFAVILWAAYVAIAFVLCGKSVMLSRQGAVYIINSFVFTLCAVALAFLLANLVHNKNALNGIINVIALGTSFLCGAFVPVEWLPDGVLKIAHILPSYWYIQTNERVKTLENWNRAAIQPLVINMCVVVAFSIGFIIIANILSVRKKEQ